MADATARELERSLNGIIDSELSKPVSQTDADLVAGCVDALLRFEPEGRYAMPAGRRERNIAAVLRPARGKGFAGMSRAAKALLIAAVILVLSLITAFCVHYAVKYDLINKFFYSEIHMSGLRVEPVEKLDTGYIPNGYVLANVIKEKELINYTYNNGHDNLIISKESYDGTVQINTEFEEPTRIDEGGVEYLIFGDKEHGYGVMFSENGWLYNVIGKESTYELLKIAKGLK